MKEALSIFEELSQERKDLQAEGKLPEWFTTVGWQTFKQSYLYEADTYEEQIDRVINTIGRHCPSRSTYFKGRWKHMLMNKHAYLATPVLANTGVSRGLSVSCSGGEIADNIYAFGNARTECGVLSQEGFGTSSHLGSIRERGAPISRGGTASGILPVFEDMVRMADNISQGEARRGAWAGYLPLEHGDFWEVADFVKNNPAGANVGWNIFDKTVANLNTGNMDTHARFQRSLLVKCIQGKGYYYFPDKVARAAPPMYAHHGLRSLASNLCTEITLHADEDHSYTCVLSGMVGSTYDEWKDTDAVYCMTIFLDCLVSEFLSLAKDIRGLENIVRGTEKGRAIGLGFSGLHSLFQQRGFAWGSFDAHLLNKLIFRHLKEESLRASQWMAKEWGEPEWCKGFGVRNTHRTALAPNVSSSMIFGSESQGCTPWYGNVYTEGSAAGSLFRVNPLFIELLKKYGQYNEDMIKSVLNNGGSCQDLDFLTDHEKEVFKTFFEINQLDVLRLASARQPDICQSQSTNLAFAADEKEEYIAMVHQVAFEDEDCHSLYYLRSKAGVTASRGACSACES